MTNTPTMPTPDAPPLARRACAALIDCALLYLAAWVAGGALAGDLGASNRAAVIDAVACLFAFGYFFATHAAFGQSLGKRLLGIRVARDGSGDRPSARQAGIRAFWAFGIGALPLAALPFSLAVFKVATAAAMVYLTINLLHILAHPRRIGIHDLLTNTEVVRA